MSIDGVNGNQNIQWSKKLADQLDAADGKKDGKIDASIWNAYTNNMNSSANKINKFINVDEAIKSIEFYEQKKDVGKVDWKNTWESKLNELLGKTENNTIKQNTTVTNSEIVTSDTELSDNKTSNTDIVNSNDESQEQIISNAIKYNDPAHANQKGVKIDNYWYDFNSDGRCERIYNKPPQKSENGDPNSFTYVDYDEDGRVGNVYQYENEGKIQDDGTRRCNVYDKNGVLESYYIESDFNANQTEARTQSYYDKDGNLTIIFKYNDKNDLCYVETYTNGKLTETEDTQHIYDSNGKLKQSITTTTTYNDNQSITTTETNNYDDNQNITQSTTETKIDGKLTETKSTQSTYTSNGKLEQDITTTTVYNNNQPITTKEITKYDENGEYKYSYEYNQEIESLIDDITKDPSKITEEKWSEYYDKIQNLNITKDSGEENVNNLYFVIEYMGKAKGTYFLDDIAKSNKDLANKIMQQVVQNEDTETDTEKHYVDDIKKDMAGHPDDYKKLTVDIQRMMHRAYIYKNDDHGDDEIHYNNQLDETTKQQTTGNCYLLSGIKAIDSDPNGRKAINSLRTDIPNGDVQIKCKGNNKTYRFTRDEVLESDYLSTGDDDMRVYELAMDKYRRDMAYKDPSLAVDSYAGSFEDVSNAFFGVNGVEYIEADDLSNEYNNGKIFNFSISRDANNQKEEISVRDIGNNNVEIPTHHQLRIVKIENNIVQYTNPWDDSEIISIPLDEFRKIEGLDIEAMDLSKITKTN